jgi:hypothetical protein
MTRIPLTGNNLRQTEIVSFVCALTLELNKRIYWHLRNGWGEKIRESIRKEVKKIEPKPNLMPSIRTLKRVWESNNTHT